MMLRAILRGSRDLARLTLSLALAAAVTVTAGAVAAAGATSDDIQAQINSLAGQRSAIQSRMDEIQDEIDSLDYERSNALEKKLILDQKNLAAQEELDVIGEQIDIMDGKLAALQNDLTEAKAEEKYQRQRWLDRVRDMEESSSVGYLEVLFQATSFSDLLTRVDLVNEVASYDETLKDKYIAARENVETLEAEAEQMYAENEARRQEWEAKKAQLDTDIDAACGLIINMSGDIDQYGILLAQEAADRDAITSMIVQKEQELAAARAAEEAARLAALAAQGGGGSAAPVPSGGTASSDGSWMIWPSYTNYLTDYYGPRNNHPVYGGYADHDGVDIGASYGSDIWSAAGGTVVFAGKYGGYGNCVMVNHGNGYTTLYGHMSSIDVSAGQSVSQGQVLGNVGSSGISTGPHLHFEVRSSSSAKAVDPMNFGYLS